MMLAPALITLASFILNIGLNAILISALGFRGAPLATSLSRVTQAVLLALFVWRLEGKKAKAKDSVDLSKVESLNPHRWSDVSEDVSVTAGIIRENCSIGRVREPELELQPLRRHSPFRPSPDASQSQLQEPLSPRSPTRHKALNWKENIQPWRGVSKWQSEWRSSVSSAPQGGGRSSACSAWALVLILILYTAVFPDFPIPTDTEPSIH